MGKKVHFITLTDEETAELNHIIATAPAPTVTRAKILLMSDSGNPSKFTTRMISNELRVSLATIQLVRKEYSEGGIDGCVYPKGKQSFRQRAFITPEKRKAIVDLINAGPTDGKSTWTYAAICEKCVKQGLFDYIAKTAIYKLIKEEKLDIFHPRSNRSAAKRDYRNKVFTQTPIGGVLISEAPMTENEEETAYEVFDKQQFVKADIRYRYDQDIYLTSGKGVLRGLRYQNHANQGKMIWVVSGEIFYVVVDLREHSKTYGKYLSVVLSGVDHKQLIVPGGFAHGYLVLSNQAEIVIKNSVRTIQDDVGGIIWNDPDIGINWPIAETIFLNEKEKNYPSLSEAKIVL